MLPMWTVMLEIIKQMKYMLPSCCLAAFGPQMLKNVNLETAAFVPRGVSCQYLERNMSPLSKAY